MARPTQFQKLSLQLDAENKKLKDKLAKTKAQMAEVKTGASKMGKGFGSSMDQMGGKAGALQGQMKGLLSSVANMNPAVLGLAGVVGAAGLAFKDLTAFTNTWEGSLTDAGRELKAVQTGLSSFITLASQQRGKALAEGGIFGWIKEATSQLVGLTNGMTLAAAAVQVGIAGVVNDALLDFQKGVLGSTVEIAKLGAETRALQNQFRNTGLIPEDRLKAIEGFKAKSLELFKIQRANAEKELAFLEQEAQLTLNDFEANLKIEQTKAKIFQLQDAFNRMIGKTVEQENQVLNAIKKQQEIKKAASVAALPELEAIKPGSTITGNENAGLKERIGLTTMLATSAASLHEETKLQQAEVITGYATMSEVIGNVANGISNVRDNWAAMTATVASGIAQSIPLIQNVIKATKALFIAKQAEANAGAIAASQSIPFPGNLVAMATSLAAVAASIAPFVGSFARGTNFIPRDGMAMVHQGEQILNRGEATRGNKIVLAGNWTIDGRMIRFVLDEDDRITGNTF